MCRRPEELGVPLRRGWEWVPALKRTVSRGRGQRNGESKVLDDWGHRPKLYN